MPSNPNSSQNNRLMWKECLEFNRETLLKTPLLAPAIQTLLELQKNIQRECGVRLEIILHGSQVWANTLGKFATINPERLRAFAAQSDTDFHIVIPKHISEKPDLFKKIWESVSKTLQQFSKPDHEFRTQKTTNGEVFVQVIDSEKNVDCTLSTDSYQTPYHNLQFEVVLERNGEIKFYIPDFKDAIQNLRNNNFIANQNIIRDTEYHHNHDDFFRFKELVSLYVYIIKTLIKSHRYSGLRPGVGVVDFLNHLKNINIGEICSNGDVDSGLTATILDVVVHRVLSRRNSLEINESLYNLIRSHEEFIFIEDIVKSIDSSVIYFKNEENGDFKIICDYVTFPIFWFSTKDPLKKAEIHSKKEDFKDFEKNIKQKGYERKVYLNSCNTLYRKSKSSKRKSEISPIFDSKPNVQKPITTDLLNKKEFLVRDRVNREAFFLKIKRIFDEIDSKTKNVFFDDRDKDRRFRAIVNKCTKNTFILNKHNPRDLSVLDLKNLSDDEMKRFERYYSSRLSEICNFIDKNKIVRTSEATNFDKMLNFAQTQAIRVYFTSFMILFGDKAYHSYYMISKSNAPAIEFLKSIMAISSVVSPMTSPLYSMARNRGEKAAIMTFFLMAIMYSVFESVKTLIVPKNCRSDRNFMLTSHVFLLLTNIFSMLVSIYFNREDFGLVSARTGAPVPAQSGSASRPRNTQ